MGDTDTSAGPDTAGVAIIGMSCRFPGAPTIDIFWNNLCDGVESITFFSAQDEQSRAPGATPVGGEAYVGAHGIVDDVELFDAAFFGFTPREAELIDPQQRLFLGCAWEALEATGYNVDNPTNRTGIFGGASPSTYLLHVLTSHPELVPPDAYEQILIGNRVDNLTTRVSYKLGLKGPGVVVLTNCSTSLVAVHLACQSLLSGESDLALAGGATISIPQHSGYLYVEEGILSPDGHCRAFDARAQGTVGGNGVGVVVLKRLIDAIADGDHIYAVIKGSTINNDGAAKVGYTAPSVDGQAAAIAETLAVANVDPATIGYVEAHGTGTALGDPVEIAALTQAFRMRTDKKGFCRIGSVKTNIGHLDTAAGVAGLIKVALALEHRLLPPSLHFERPNPRIDFDNSPFVVNTTLAEWVSPAGPRRAAVSSLGIGGTNAHAILEEAPPMQPPAPSRTWHMLAISAKTRTALETATDHLVAYLTQHPGQHLADVAYTLLAGRRAFDYRRILVCRDLPDALPGLAARDPKRVLTSAQRPGPRPVAFLFPGQGSQYIGMGKALYQEEPLFREQLDRCAELLKPLLGLDLRDLLYPDLRIEDRGLRIEDTESSILNPLSSILDQTQYAQPALFAIEYALAQVWMAWGVRPQAMLGHSIGEYVAACLAGVFSLAEALALVATRGRLMQQMPEGAMLAVALPEQALTSLLDADISLAAINSPSACVVAGPVAAIERLQGQLQEQQVVCRRLRSSHAFHSNMMEPVVECFARDVRAIALRAPQIAYISNVTGSWITAAEAQDPAYWATHLRQTVRFGAGLQQLLSDQSYAGDWILLEVGPGQSLSSLVNGTLDPGARSLVLPTLRHPRDQRSDPLVLHTALSQLWLTGIPIDWPAFYANQRRRRVPLPTYPFEPERHWLEPARIESCADAHANAPEPVAPENSAQRQPADSIVHTNGAGSEAQGQTQPAGGLERILAQQLQILTQQLAILESL